VKLAQSEREEAWREMAKQVAHGEKTFDEGRNENAQRHRQLSVR
jgi:hypothetical protein